MHQPKSGFADSSSPLSVAVAEDSARIVDRVAEALRARRLRLAYQPVVLSARPDRIGFHEGLIRILDPGGRTIPAREFMQAIEGRDLGREVDCAALAMGLDALRRHPALRLSVNMSARSIGWPRWMRILRRSLDRDPALGERLILEISEASAMTVPELLAGFMAELRPRRISFALDGFGAGPVTLHHFRELAFDVMKIDAGFTRNVHATADSQVMMSVFLAIARQLDMLTVAQGVEAAADSAWITALGIDCQQGFFHGAPKLFPDGIAPDPASI
jgi:EAL domain-containing protein (putative c-di-GMP-specific phosphodiesterase class I)